jgi:hypothetical protein
MALASAALLEYYELVETIDPATGEARKVHRLRAPKPMNQRVESCSHDALVYGVDW